MRVCAVALYFLPVTTRVPLKFGTQTIHQVSCARVQVTVESASGKRATGWGETPLSAAWVWPDDTISYQAREKHLQQFCLRIANCLRELTPEGHPFQIGYFLQQEVLSDLAAGTPLPHLAALLCLSAFDLALYDAFGNLLGAPVFQLFGPEHNLPALESIFENDTRFKHRSIADYLRPPQLRLPVWHLVGGVDAISEADFTGSEPDDGYPVLLRDWIRRDGLKCLKIKLRGTDPAWDYERLCAVGRIAEEEQVHWLSADFNCTVTDPAVVCEILDRLLKDEPALYAKLLYVEQPFPYDLHAHPLDVRSVTARKPLFLDESAHDWRYVRLGRELGWSSVALKTCKTLTGALLSLCWAREYGMTLMVQDLTNPMLAQIPHFLLAAHAGTIMGVESNGMQFYPEASAPEAAVHHGLYQRRQGLLDGQTLGAEGFGYRINAISRTLPAAAG
jgi:L-alanine-DL-glutamate epimerase-like enolase superfamily enzyme